MKNAILSAIPYLAMWVFSLVVAQIADLTARRSWASTNVIRKTANTIGNVSKYFEFPPSCPATWWHTIPFFLKKC